MKRKKKGNRTFRIVYVPVKFLRNESEESLIRGRWTGQILSGQADNVQLKPQEGCEKNEGESSQQSSTTRSHPRGYGHTWNVTQTRKHTFGKSKISF